MPTDTRRFTFCKWRHGRFRSSSCTYQRTHEEVCGHHNWPEAGWTHASIHCRQHGGSVQVEIDWRRLHPFVEQIHLRRFWSKNMQWEWGKLIFTSPDRAVDHHTSENCGPRLPKGRGYFWNAVLWKTRTYSWPIVTCISLKQKLHEGEKLSVWDAERGEESETSAWWEDKHSEGVRNNQATREVENGDEESFEAETHPPHGEGRCSHPAQFSKKRHVRQVSQWHIEYF